MGRLAYYGSPGSTTSSGSVVEGPKGDPGGPGPVGVLYGEGVPSNGIGTNGQGYIDELNGDLYTKSSGVWQLKSSLRGPEGDDGDPGPVILPWIFKTSNPVAGDGVVGQTCLNTVTYELFYKSDVSTWESKGNIKGAAGTGTPGDTGSGFANVVSWQSGVAYPVVNGQRPVVTYLGETYTSNANVPSRGSFTSGDWIKITQKGADGEANIPANVVLKDAANTFAVAEQNGGLFTFFSYNFTEMPTLTITSANEGNYTGREVGFTSNTGTNIFELRIDGTVSKGFNMKVRREGTAKVRIVPNNTNAVGHSEQIPTIDATHPAYIANQYGAAIVEVRYKANSSSCDFLVDANLATS